MLKTSLFIFTLSICCLTGLQAVIVDIFPDQSILTQQNDPHGQIKVDLRRFVSNAEEEKISQILACKCCD